MELKVSSMKLFNGFHCDVSTDKGTENLINNFKISCEYLAFKNL